MQLCYSNVDQADNGLFYSVGEELAGHKVRYRLRLDNYANQSYAVVEVWSPALLKWNEVATYRPENWWVSRYSDHEVVMEAFGDALEELRGRALATLS